MSLQSPYLKSLFLLFSVLLLSTSIAIGQCPPSSIILSTQAEVDNFSINYPNCSILNQNLTIDGGTSISNLNGLIAITGIEGDLIITGNSNLTNLNGLNNLTIVEDQLEISNNGSLINLTGLESLESTGTSGSVYDETIIADNPNLENLMGLENLTTLDDGISIKNNSSLTSLSGLENITETGSHISSIFEIDNNNNLTNLNGLNNLTFVEGAFSIANNDNLISLTGLEALNNVVGYLTVENNNLLPNLTGIENLSLSGVSSVNFTISDNNNLVSLNGLNSLNFVPGTLTISGNAILQNLTGLETLTSMSELHIWQNPLLVSLTGLENVVSVGNTISILGNENLPNLNGLSGVTTLGFNLEIKSNDNLLSLEGLTSLTSIGKDLVVSFNDSLVNFTGLEGITTIGGFEIEGNEVLQNFEGLNNLTTTLGAWSIITNNIEANPSLLNFSGLESLAYIEDGLRLFDNNNLLNMEGLDNLEMLNGTFDILNNSALVDFQGLENLLSINGLFRISNNDVLTSITNLQNLNAESIDHLTIKFNSNLSSCASNFVCKYIENSSNITNISDNAVDCNSRAEVATFCDSGFGFYTFYDENENGLFENNEVLFEAARITINPGDYSLYSNTANGSFYHLPYGTYTVTFDESINPLWELTTSPAAYTIILDETNPSDTFSLAFGVHPSVDFSEISTVIHSGLPRCNDLVEVNAILENTGTTITDGTLWLEIDEAFDNVDYVDSPDIIVAPNKYGWNFTNLYPSQTLQKQIKVQMPGPPDFVIGNTVDFRTYSDFDDLNGSHASDTCSFETIVLCSYDPNDKLVSPVYPNNYALMSEDLVYTIRFQNTGNAEAYDVVIRDTLDSNLAPSTFKIISSSHPEVLSTIMDEDQFLTFSFIDINLPDSTSNFVESQGFIMYKIQVKEDLPEETIVQNTAHIYFDSNPAITTNTTVNVMLSTFDSDQDGYDLFVDCDDNNAGINPGAEEIVNNGIDEDCDGMDTSVFLNEVTDNNWSVYPNPTSGIIAIVAQNFSNGTLLLKDISGQIVLKKSIEPKMNIDISSFPAGVYLLQIQADQQLFSRRIVKY